MSDRQPVDPITQARWIVSVDHNLCGLCEVCARHCPTGALHSEQEGSSLRIIFESSLCDGCPELEDYQARCTERALSRTPSEAAAVETNTGTILVEGELVACSHCGEPFASSRKLAAVSKRAEHTRILREFCPLCRRTQLVLRFIDEKRRPDAKAESRSAREILKRAGHWMGKK